MHHKYTAWLSAVARIWPMWRHDSDRSIKGWRLLYRTQGVAQNQVKTSWLLPTVHTPLRLLARTRPRVIIRKTFGYFFQAWSNPLKILSRGHFSFKERKVWETWLELSVAIIQNGLKFSQMQKKKTLRTKTVVYCHKIEPYLLTNHALLTTFA